MKNIDQFDQFDQFDKHSDRRKPQKKKPFIKEDFEGGRKSRVSFKNFIRDMDEEIELRLQEEELEAAKMEKF